MPPISRADIVEDRDRADRMGAEVALHLKEGPIEILRAMAEEVEGGHHQHDPEDRADIALDRGPDRLPLCRRALRESWAFGNVTAQEIDQHCVQRADRTRGQGYEDRDRDRLDRGAELLGHILEHEDDDEEIEGVEHPAEIARENGIALIPRRAAQRFDEKVHGAPPKQRLRAVPASREAI